MNHLEIAESELTEHFNILAALRLTLVNEHNRFRTRQEVTTQKMNAGIGDEEEHAKQIKQLFEPLAQSKSACIVALQAAQKVFITQLAVVRQQGMHLESSYVTQNLTLKSASDYDVESLSNELEIVSGDFAVLLATITDFKQQQEKIASAIDRLRQIVVPQMVRLGVFSNIEDASTLDALVTRQANPLQEPRPPLLADIEHLIESWESRCMDGVFQALRQTRQELKAEVDRLGNLVELPEPVETAYLQYEAEMEAAKRIEVLELQMAEMQNFLTDVHARLEEVLRNLQQRRTELMGAAEKLLEQLHAQMPEAAELRDYLQQVEAVEEAALPAYLNALQEKIETARTAGASSINNYRHIIQQNPNYIFESEKELWQIGTAMIAVADQPEEYRGPLWQTGVDILLRALSNDALNTAAFFDEFGYRVIARALASSAENSHVVHAFGFLDGFVPPDEDDEHSLSRLFAHPLLIEEWRQMDESSQWGLNPAEFSELSEEFVSYMLLFLNNSPQDIMPGRIRRQWLAHLSGTFELGSQEHYQAIRMLTEELLQANLPLAVYYILQAVTPEYSDIWDEPDYRALLPALITKGLAYGQSGNDFLLEIIGDENIKRLAGNHPSTDFMHKALVHYLAIKSQDHSLITEAWFHWETIEHEFPNLHDLLMRQLRGEKFGLNLVLDDEAIQVELDQLLERLDRKVNEFPRGMRGILTAIAVYQWYMEKYAQGWFEILQNPETSLIELHKVSQEVETLHKKRDDLVDDCPANYEPPGRSTIPNPLEGGLKSQINKRILAVIDDFRQAIQLKEQLLTKEKQRLPAQDVLEEEVARLLSDDQRLRAAALLLQPHLPFLQEFLPQTEQYILQDEELSESEEKLLFIDTDTLHNLPIILIEQHKSRPHDLQSESIYQTMLASLAQGRNITGWFDYFVNHGQMALARRLLPDIGRVPVNHFRQLINDWNRQCQVEIGKLQRRISSQQALLGEEATKIVQQMLDDEVRQLITSEWFGLAIEQLDTIEGLLRSEINKAQAQRDRLFEEAQNLIMPLRKKIIFYESELKQADTFELAWELLWYCDRLAASATGSLQQIEQLTQEVKNLYEGGAIRKDLLRQMRQTFDVPAPGPTAATAAAAPRSRPTPESRQPGEGDEVRLKLLKMDERKLFYEVVGEDLALLEVELIQASSKGVVRNEDEVRALESKTRAEAVIAMSRFSSNAPELVNAAATLLNQTRGILAYWAGRKQQPGTVERELTSLFSVFLEMKARAYLIQGLWDVAAAYYRMVLQLLARKENLTLGKGAVLSYLAAYVLNRPAQELIDNWKEITFKEAPVLISTAMGVISTTGKHSKATYHNLALGLLKLGSENEWLQRQIMTALAGMDEEQVAKGLKQGFYQLAKQLKLNGDGELLDIYQTLAAYYRQILQRARAVLLRLQQQSIASLTIDELVEPVMELRGMPLLWDATDSRFLKDLAEIASTLPQYLDPQLDFQDRAAIADQVLEKSRVLAADIINQPTVLGNLYLAYIIDNIRTLVEDEHAQLRQAARPRLDVSVIKSEWRSDGRYYCHLCVENSGEIRADEVMLEVIESRVGDYKPISRARELGTIYPGQRPFELIAIEPKPAEEEFDAFTLSLLLRFREPEQKQAEKRAIQLRVENFAQDIELSEPIINPYVVGPTVEDPDMFKGRDDLISRLLEVLSHPDHIGSVVLFGQKRSGKTSLLYHLGHRVPESIISIRMDVSSVLTALSKENHEEMLGRFLLAIAILIYDTTRGLNSARGLAIQSEPITWEALMAEPGPGFNFKQYLGRFRNANPGYRLLLLFDEFTGLLDKIDEAVIDGTIMRLFKSLIDDHLLSLVICGVNEAQPAVERFANQLAASLIQQVDYLDYQAAAELIEEPIRLPDGRSRFYSEEIIKTIFDLTAGSPFYTQIFCQRLVEYLNEMGIERITLADIPQVVVRLTQGRKRLSAVDFDNLYMYRTSDKEADRQAILEGLIVHLMAHETVSKPYVSASALYNKVREIIAQDEFVAVLGKLEHRQTIVQERHDREGAADGQNHYLGQNYRLRVDLFRQWLLSNHPMDDVVLNNFSLRLQKTKR